MFKPPLSLHHIRAVLVNLSLNQLLSVINERGRAYWVARSLEEGGNNSGVQFL
jgi:hypothetical protein